MDEPIDNLEIIRERYLFLPEEVAELFEYHIFDAVVNELTSIHRLDRQQKTLLENEIILTLLFLLPRDSFQTRVHETLELSRAKTRELYDYADYELFGLSENLFRVTDSKFKESAAQSDEAADEAVEPRPAEVARTNSHLSIPRQVTAVEPLRTMNLDAKRIHGYGAGTPPAGETATEPTHQSSQEQLIKKDEPNPDLPSTSLSQQN